MSRIRFRMRRNGVEVAHKGGIWLSGVDNNIWEPGAVGVHENIWKRVRRVMVE